MRVCKWVTATALEDVEELCLLLLDILLVHSLLNPTLGEPEVPIEE